MSATHWGRSPWLALAITGTLTLFGALGSFPRRALAASLPGSPAYSYYVTSAWASTAPNGQTNAYNYGYNATPGDGAYIYIVLDFGRQVDGAGGWGVYLPGTTTPEESDLWVSTVATDFMDGYSANPNNTTAIGVSIGTNNNDPWTATSTWTTAGAEWGSLVSHISTPGLVVGYSGVDIETWGCGTSTCDTGSQMEAWFGGSTSGFDQYGQVNLNYGDNTAAIDPTYWSQSQLFDVSYGDVHAIVAPEIYCQGNASEWATTNSDNSGSLYFNSVSSANGSQVVSNGYICQNNSPDSYTWSQAWDHLYTALGAYNGNLDSGVTIF